MRNLVPGQTKIGTQNAKDKNNIILTFTVYYGNVLEPPIDGKIGHLPKNNYRTMLEEFLNSEEGEEYAIPTEDEVEQASKDMLNKETEILMRAKLQQEREKKIQERKKEEEETEAAPKEEVEETNTSDARSSKKGPAVQKTVHQTKSDKQEDKYEDDDDEVTYSLLEESLKKKVIALIIVIVVQFIAICFLATLTLFAPKSSADNEVKETNEEPTQEVIEQTESNMLIGTWSYQSTVVDYKELATKLEQQIDAAKDEMTDEELAKAEAQLEEYKSLNSQVTVDDNYKETSYTFEDTGKYINDGVKTCVTLFPGTENEEVSCTTSTVRGTYTVDEDAKLITLISNTTVANQIVMEYYVTDYTLTLTTNNLGVITHYIYQRN